MRLAPRLWNADPDAPGTMRIEVPAESDPFGFIWTPPAAARLWNAEPDAPGTMRIGVPAEGDPFGFIWTPPAAAPLAQPVAARPIADDVIAVDRLHDVEAPAQARIWAGIALTGGAPIGALAVRSTYVSGPAGSYNIELRFQGGWTVAMQDIFIAAADRLSALIVGDVPAARVGGRTVDDLVIQVELSTIDGAGGVLGQAGPTALRINGFLPAAATMRFDIADAQAYLDQGLFDEIVTHEMLHAVGFGTIWDRLDLLGEAGFLGVHAVAEYGKLVSAQAEAVPVETEGGAGTALSHWDEAALGHELMTGWLDVRPRLGGTPDPLSALTVASLRDLGYAVAERGPVDWFALVG